MTEPAKQAQTPQLQISGRNLRLTPRDREDIAREAARLSRFYDRIIGCRVLVEASHRYPTGTAVEYAVRIQLEVPDDDIAVTRRSHRDQRTAVQQAFRAARRQLEDRSRRQRGQVKTSEGSPRGRIAQLFSGEGYGFLEAEDGRSIYFHENSVVDGRFGDLDVGSDVRFVERRGREGPQASTVAIVGKGRRARRKESTARRRPA